MDKLQIFKSRVLNVSIVAGELFKQHSRSNETLPTPPPFVQHEARKAISRSENQLNSIEFQPFLDAEGSDTTPPCVFVEEKHAVGQGADIADYQLPDQATKLHRGGLKKGVGSSMRSNSQESEGSHLSRSSHTPSLTSLSSAEGDPDSGSTLSAEVEGQESSGGIIQVRRSMSVIEFLNQNYVLQTFKTC